MNRTAALQIYLTEHKASRLRPGQFDCALFAAAWVTRVNGIDLARGWRRAYRSLDDGFAQLARAGFASLGDYFASRLTEIPGWMGAQVGDVVTLDEDGQEAMGIVGGSFVHCIGVDGLVVVPIFRAIRVFRP